MGLELDFVASEERHYDNFVCVICQNLVDLDCLVTAPCSHCFCNKCLVTWLDRQTGNYNCPTCNTNLEYTYRTNLPNMMVGKHTVLVQPLSQAQPLAHRVLKSVLVSCPLQGVCCPWKGDYSDLESHLLSKTAHTAVTTTTQPQSRQPQHVPMQGVVTVSENDQDNDEKETVEDDANEIVFGSPSPSSSSSHTKPKTLSECQNQEQQQQSGPSAFEQLCIQNRSLAKSFKEQANNQFSSGHIQQAKSLYTKAIDILLQTQEQQQQQQQQEYQDKNEDIQLLAALYANRSACCLSLSAYHDAIQDCQKTIALDPNYIKAHVRLGKAHVQLGNFQQAHTALQKACQQNQTSTVLVRQLQQTETFLKCYQQGIQQLQNEHRYAAAKATFAKLLLEAPSSPILLLCAAQADLGLGNTDSVLRITLKLLRNNNNNNSVNNNASNATHYHPQFQVEACQLRGQAMVFMGEMDSGIKLLQEALRLDPDSVATKKVYRRYIEVRDIMKKAESALFHRRFQETVALTSQAIVLLVSSSSLSSPSSSSEGQQLQTTLPSNAPLYATLYTQRAQAYLRLKNYEAALKDVALVVYAQEGYIPAWLVKFQAYHALERHEEAFAEVSDLIRKFGHGNHELLKAYETADFNVRKQKRPDFYKLLDVSPIASTMEIKKAYRRKAMECHPDKLPPNCSDSAKAEKAKQFQLLGEALEILCDDFQRKLYDEGYDQKAIRERVEAAHRGASSGGGHQHHHHHG